MGFFILLFRVVVFMAFVFRVLLRSASNARFVADFAHFLSHFLSFSHYVNLHFEFAEANDHRAFLLKAGVQGCQVLQVFAHKLI